MPELKKRFNFAKHEIIGEVAEWSNAAVLKTVVPQGTGGSNPSFSADFNLIRRLEYPPLVVQDALALSALKHLPLPLLHHLVL